MELGVVDFRDRDGDCTLVDGVSLSWGLFITDVEMELGVVVPEALAATSEYSRMHFS